MTTLVGVRAGRGLELGGLRDFPGQQGLRGRIDRGGARAGTAAGPYGVGDGKDRGREDSAERASEESSSAAAPPGSASGGWAAGPPLRLAVAAVATVCRRV